MTPQAKRLTPEELLQPRYEVIADYFYSPYNIGDLVEFTTTGTSFLGTVTKQYDDFREDIVDTENYFHIDCLKKYNHLFRRLDWWEHRTPEEMPEYVKCKINSCVYKVSVPRKYGVDVLPYGYWLYDRLTPATLQDYTQYITNLNANK